jgi:hypothetical protein
MLPLRSRLRAQPQRDVGWLHSLPNYVHQIFAQGLQIRLVSDLGREGFKGLSSVVLPTVEAPVYEALDASPQRIEEPTSGLEPLT